MKKNMIIIVPIVAIVLLLIGGTYAWFTWSGSQNSNIVLTIGDFAGFVKSSTNINVSNLAPVLDYKSTTAYSNIVVSGTVDTNTYSGVKTTMTLNITSNTFSSSYNDFKYAVYNKTSGTLVSNGVLNGKTGSITLYTTTSTSSSLNINYVVYIYIDGTNRNSTDYMGKKLAGTLTVTSVGISK